MRSMKLATALATIALVAAACSSTAATPVPSAAPSVAPSVVPAVEAPSAAPSAEAPSVAPSVAPTEAPLTGELTVWNAYGSGGTAEGKAFEQILAEYAKVQPGVTINVLDVPFDQLYTKFETEAASGGGPDMYIAPNDNLGNEVRAGLLADVTDVVTPMEADTVQVALDGSKVDGKYYMVPESLKAVAMFYNKDKVATPPATADELLALVKSGVKVGVNQGAYHNWGYWYGFGGQIMDDTGKCVADQAGVADAMAYLKALKDAGATFYPDGAKFQDAFKTGKLDLIIEGPWFSGDAKAAYGDKLGVAPGPKQTADFKPMTGVDGWYLNASSKNLDLAKAVAAWLVSQQAQQIYVDVAGHVPGNKNISIADPIVQGFSTAVATGFARPQIVELNNYWGNFGDALNKVIDAGADPVAAVATACSEMNKANGK